MDKLNLNPSIPPNIYNNPSNERIIAIHTSNKIEYLYINGNSMYISSIVKNKIIDEVINIREYNNKFLIRIYGFGEGAYIIDSTNNDVCVYISTIDSIIIFDNIDLAYDIEDYNTLILLNTM